MNETRLREGLPAAEPASAELQRKYRERMRALLEHRLTATERAGHLLGLVIALGMTARFVQLILQHRAGGRPIAIAGILVGLAFSVGWAAVSFAVVRRGVDHLRRLGIPRTYLIVSFLFLLAGLMLWAGLTEPDPARGNQLILFGLVFWAAIGLPFLVAHLVRDSELRVRSDVLRIELAMAEASEERGVRS
jgi:hypothetical protein